ncbi:MAG: membrane protein insertase YidC [Acidobacteria bacterium]|nr:membrane protein insertase YidC [Acidobacteriota bacterium]
MEKRLILFLILSAAIFLGWSHFFATQPETPGQNDRVALTTPSPSPSVFVTPESQKQPAPASPTLPTTQAELRQIKVKTAHWDATLSNKGGVVTDWTMTRFPDGKAIDSPKGVNLVSSELSQKVGGQFRFYIPKDQSLENELNSAVYESKNPPDQEIVINEGERKEITFSYANNGVEATKKIVFKGKGYENSSGFDFDFVGSVRRNGNPVPEAYVVIGPNFGDQSVKEVSTYKHAPQLTYATADGSVYRETADSLQGAAPRPSSAPVTWAAVDDNYFAMAIVPEENVPAISLLNDKYVSIAVSLKNDEVNNVYAGPKDIALLSRVSTEFGINNKTPLEDIVSYGIFDYVRGMIKPIAQFMLQALRYINQFTHNFGWSIVILTVALNMLFFPLRWRSSVIMKRAAALQPQMKDIQERMKKLEKNDPRMLDLQKEQIALMKQGNPLMGCLPLLLQMPFFMAVFAILTVSIEVRNAPFIGWIQDLSSQDPFYILPIVMCVTMIAQTALTPTTADPIQKKLQYILPVILTVAFFISAPAGLVLYWMVGNLVGVAQQYVINRLNPTIQPAAAADSSDSGRPGPKPPKGKPGPKSSKGRKTKEALSN